MKHEPGVAEGDLSISLQCQIIIPFKSWSGSINLEIADDGPGVGTATGDGFGMGGYAGIGSGLSVDDGHLSDGNYTHRVGRAKGIATPAVSGEIYQADDGAIHGAGISAGPGVVGVYYNETRKGGVIPLFTW